MSQPAAYPVKKQPTCADCKIRPAVINRGKDSVCVECYNEKPLSSLSQWDRVINPAFILALESKLDAMIATVARLERTIDRLSATIDATIADS